MGIIDYICVFLIFATAFVAIIYPIYYFLYKEKHEYLKSLNEIPFKSFVAFYNIAPTKWTLNKSCVIYETIDAEILDAIEQENQTVKERQWTYIFDGIYKTPKKTYKFTFKFTDLIQYRIWHKSILHNEKIKQKKYKQEQLYKQYQDALKEISKDLEQFKQSKPWEDIK